MIRITYAITFVGSLQELMLIKIVARTFAYGDPMWWSATNSTPKDLEHYSQWNYTSSEKSIALHRTYTESKRFLNRSRLRVTLHTEKALCSAQKEPQNGIFRWFTAYKPPSLSCRKHQIVTCLFVTKNDSHQRLSLQAPEKFVCSTVWFEQRCFDSFHDFLLWTPPIFTVYVTVTLSMKFELYGSEE